MIKKNYCKPYVLNAKVSVQLQPEDRNVFAIFTRGWFVEGFFYITFIALIWSNEEPAKLNTLLAAWSAYAIVAFVLFQAIKSGTVVNPNKWIRIYFIQSLLLLLVCDFIWMRGSVVRADGDFFDPIRFDYYAVLLADARMNPNAVIAQNYTGTIWYAGFIYWIFGVSKFYIVLFNGALSFVTWILFASVMRHMEGNPFRWQWLRFGIILPDFILPFANVSKEPLSAFVVALGVWVIAKSLKQKVVLSKLFLLLIPILTLGLIIRPVTSIIVILVALIWFWNSAGKKGRIACIVLLLVVVLSGQFVSSYMLKITGSSRFSWNENISLLFDPQHRLREKIDYSPTGWNTLTESMPIYLMPIIAPIKGFFMMISPMPLWQLHPTKVVDDVVFSANYGSPVIMQLFPKINAWLFILSLPFLVASVFDVCRSNRRLWLRSSFTFIIIVTLMGFAVYGMIHARYRPMLLPFWLSVCGVGYYYGNPKRYILPCIGIAVIGFIIYMIPKI